MSSNSIFLDTNGWLLLLNASEKWHTLALKDWLGFMHERCRVVLTDWVIAETGNVLARSQTKGRFVQIVDEMMHAPSVEIVQVDDDMLRRALSDYGKHTHKSWGLVDCASFLVMRGITSAFTTDSHFAQAGFSCLLPHNK